MKSFKILMLSLLVLAVLGSSMTFADKKQEEEQAKMMKAWMKYMTPGPEHKYLEKFVGEWEGETTVWMAPGAPPTKSKASSSAKMIMGGRYLLSKYKGAMGGMPFNGMSIVAYDNHLKKFVSTWCDSMSTGVFYSKGERKGNVRTEKAKWYDIVSGDKIMYRSVITLEGDNKYTMQMYMTQKGQKEFKGMEMVLTKKK